MHKLKVIFKRIINYLHAAVPPLYLKIDQEHHYEVWAKNDNKETFFAKVVLNESSADLAFYKDLTREEEWLMFPGDIFKRMENTFECHISDLSPELEDNIKEVIDNLLQYFVDNKLLPPPEKF
ncbi:MAG: hypothetical protein Q4F97_03680 [Bacteroidales bacterium]|nr:hypothetical protein [Bacteroidales bacterium]